MREIAADATAAIRVEVDGRPVAAAVAPRLLLTDFLQHIAFAHGVHVGCEQGICGACTVLIDGRIARACLTFAIQADGQSVKTVASLAAPDGTLNTLQQAFARHFALQCGFCTPGILMSATRFLQDNPKPSRDDVRHMLSGHLCRCTGYYPIIEAILDAAGEHHPPSQETPS